MKLQKYTIVTQIGPRHGALLELHENGKIGLGDIAPLPPWSQESLDAAMQDAHKGCFALPSCNFAFDAAKLMLSRAPAPLRLPVAPLIQNSADAQAFIGKATSAKIKLGHLSDEEARALIQALQGKFRLRVDLNRKWPLERSRSFFAQFSPEIFEYIEEPCTTLEDLFAFPFPLALDETLREHPLEKLLAIPTLQALIYKPTLHGGLSIARTLKTAAQKRHIDLIFSSCYESGVGIRAIAYFAEELNLTEKPFGIDTYRYLHEDVLKERLNFQPGWINIAIC